METRSNGKEKSSSEKGNSSASFPPLPNKTNNKPKTKDAKIKQSAKAGRPSTRNHRKCDDGFPQAVPGINPTKLFEEMVTSEPLITIQGFLLTYTVNI